MPLVCKGDLIRVLGLSAYMLNRHIFTDLVLSKMGLSRAEYKATKYFTVEQSQFIKEHIFPLVKKPKG